MAENTLTQEQALNRIKKCLAIAENAGAAENEAATALRQAQALMRKYNIDRGQVGILEIAEDVIQCLSAWKKVPQWELSLIAMICSAFGGQVMIRTYPTYLEKLAEFHIIGIKHQLPAIKYAYGVLRRQIMAGRVRYLKDHCNFFSRGMKISRGESYCLGFVLRVHEQVDAFAMTPEQKGEIERRLNEATGGAEYKSTKKAKEIDLEAYRAGARAGASARLHRPVGGGK